MKADVADSTPVYRTFPDAWLIGPVPYVRNRRHTRHPAIKIPRQHNEYAPIVRQRKERAGSHLHSKPIICNVMGGSPCTPNTQ